MIVYRISGSLPCPWEDFFCVDGSHKNITLSASSHEPLFGSDVIEDDGDDIPCDGWLDIDLDVDEICEDIARLAIAEALGIDNPEDIVIDQAGFCQSV